MLADQRAGIAAPDWRLNSDSLGAIRRAPGDFQMRTPLAGKALTPDGIAVAITESQELHIAAGSQASM
jgi:hypothetical protein